jgi:O-antigen/teichoic acid export membrane protein
MTDASVTSRNLSAVFLMRIAQFPFLALFVILVPRMMGSEGYGEFAFLLSIVAILTSFINLGIGDTCGRFVPELQATEGESGVTRFASNFLSFKSLVSPAVIIAMTPVLQWIYADRVSAASLILVALIVLVVDWESVVYSLLFGQNRLVVFSLREPLRRAVSLALILVLFPRFGLIGALTSTLLVEIAMLLLAAYWTRRSFALRDLRFDLGFLKPYLTFGIAVYLVWLLLSIWQRLGNVMIEHITRDSSQVAYFDIANQFFLVVISITVMVINSLIPMFSAFMLDGREGKMQAWTRRLVKYMSIVTMLAFGGLLLLGSDLIPIMIGQEFDAVFPNVMVLSSALFPSLLVQVGFVYAVVDKQPRRFLLALVVAVSVCIALSLALIPVYSSIGCSIATAASYWLMAALVLYPMRGHIGPLLKDIVVVLLPGAMLPLLAYFKADAWLNAALTGVFIAAYLALLFLIRALSIVELREIIDALRGRKAVPK